MPKWLLPRKTNTAQKRCGKGTKKNLSPQEKKRRSTQAANIRGSGGKFTSQPIVSEIPRTDPPIAPDVLARANKTILLEYAEKRGIKKQSMF